MKKIYILALVIFTFSCSDRTTTIEDVSWLNGTWTREFNGNTQVETWSHEGTNLQGTSAFVNGSDTTTMTNFKMLFNEGNTFLTSEEIGFDTEVKYTMEESTASHISFFNANAEWPQHISYNKLDSNKLEITINGADRQMNKSATFTYSKLE